MEKINLVFCVLTYKNHIDLLDFIQSLNNLKNKDFTHKIVVINNYADDKSLKKIREISIARNCDFIESENKGYSFGNNLGITYANSNYSYEYLIVCNPDVIIKRLEYMSLKNYGNDIIAPEIFASTGKRQNPMYYKFMPLSEMFVYYSMMKNRRILYYIGVAMNKFDRYIKNIFFNFSKKDNVKIYAAHGSFIIFSRSAIDKLYPVFDENLFLFCEESDLAKSAEQRNVDIIYDKAISIYHKEDGSMNVSDENLKKILKESYLYYYNKWNSR